MIAGDMMPLIGSTVAPSSAKNFATLSTAAFMLGHPAQSFATYGYSLAFTLPAAILLAFTRAWAGRVPQEALIGVIYVVAAAAAILMIDRAGPGRRWKSVSAI